MLRRKDSEDIVADTADRLAVMLRSGIAPDRAWRYLADVDRHDDVARIADRIASGERAATAIAAAGQPWAAMSSAWRIANEVGAPLSETLRAIGSAVRDEREVADDVDIALAEPAMTARIMTWLPAAGLILSFALGFDVFAIVTTNPIGIACVVGGVALMLVSRSWSKRLVTAARRMPPAPGLRQELMAIALSGGGSVARARDLVADADVPDTDDDATERVLALSQRAGVPAVDLLRQDAADERRRTRTAARVGAARLSGRLLLPLGICTLPAFFLLGVAPMMLSILTSTQIAW